MKIECLPNTVLPIDERVIGSVQSSRRFVPLVLDSEFLELLQMFHGGVPVKPYFTIPNGDIRRIGWFVSFLDDQSPIPGPFEKGIYFPDLDTRVSDRSIPSVCANDLNNFFFGERMYPFAALYTDGSIPVTLRRYSKEFIPDDSICFDRTTVPQSVVIYCGEKADEVVKRVDDGEVEWDEIDYDSFSEKIANSFAEFVEMLREEP